jgi:hypothetical protein
MIKLKKVQKEVVLKTNEKLDSLKFFNISHY